jgi:hypothetical protein
VLKGAQFLTVTDAPPLPTLPTGAPLIYWRLPGGFPSVNEILYLSPKSRAEIVRGEVDRGYVDGIAYGESLGLKLAYRDYQGKPTLRLTVPYITVPVFCFVSVWRGDRKRRDVYNAAVKAYIDGGTKAGLWVDDGEAYHTDFWVHFAGRLTSYAELSFYAVSR